MEVVMRGLLIVVLAGCIDEAPTPAPPGPVAESANEIIATTIATYASLHGYIDHGRVTTTFTGKGAHTHTQTFETSFERPSRFRFRFVRYESDGRPVMNHTITMDKTGVHSRDANGDVETEPDIGSALGAEAGVSETTSYTIPSLLGVAGIPPWLGDVVDTRLEGSDVVGGHPCWRITAGTREVVTQFGTAPPRKYTISIDRGSHAIRRIVESVHMTPPNGDAFDVEKVFVYEPDMNPPTI